MKPQTGHPWPAALASFQSAKHSLLPALLFVALALTACGRAPVATRPPLPVLERPTLTLRSGPEQLRIPRAVLVERGGIPGVFVLETGGARPDTLAEARFRMVRPGHTDGDRLIILAGLHGNETLVLGDLRSVRDGSPITAMKNAKLKM